MSKVNDAVRASFTRASLTRASFTAVSSLQTTLQQRLPRGVTTRRCRWMTAQRMLMVMWLLQGVLPLTLQARSYLKFAHPHTISDILVVLPDLEKETVNLTELCPVQAFVLAGIWWNVESTHYYKANQGIVCHSVVPQYNVHGNYVIGNTTVPPFHTSPASCANDSYPYELYMYHGSVGFFSFYEGEVGTYCAKDRTTYSAVEVLGTYDINGKFLAEDTGSTKPRMSFWYTLTGGFWLVYRVLTIRRSFMTCRRYGRRCAYLGETLNRHEATVFVQESLRLSAHEATNYHRSALLYLVIEGIMTDLFLIIANDGWTARVQYTSLGYNFSGLMLLLFEMLENMRWLSEKWRLRIKRMFFSYETALVGELASALVFQAFLSKLNGSDLKRSEPTALAVSYYFWSVVCHGILAIIVVLIISSVRVPWALMFVWIKHRSLAVFSETCCLDSVLGARSRSMLLGGYQLADGKLYYKRTALKAYGLLETEEEGTKYLVMHKLHWFTVPRENLVGIGVISGHRVESCNEKPCSGIVRFLDRTLGGVSNSTHQAITIRPGKVMAWSGPDNGNLASPTVSLFPAHLRDNRV